MTERAVFKLRAEGLELVEVASGLQADVLVYMAFVPIMRDVQVMDAALHKPVEETSCVFRRHERDSHI